MWHGEGVDGGEGEGIGGGGEGTPVVEMEWVRVWAGKIGLDEGFGVPG